MEDNVVILRLNTSNFGKFEEFKRLFESQGVTIAATHEDLDEIEADLITVVTHKASQLDEQILVEDTALDIEGASIGINIRWLLEHLGPYIGHKAIWTTLLAYRTGKNVSIFRGQVSGTISSPRGSGGYGFDAIFIPNGSNFTLAECKADSHNARAKAVAAFLSKNIWTCRPMIEKWEGPWQKK